jgi:hypothetical protein
MLRSFLAAEFAGNETSRWNQRTMRAHLGEPWCWPADPVLSEHCRARLGCSEPALPPSGRALLVSVTPSGKASLWELTTERPPALGCAEFIGLASETSRMAARLAARDLPFLGDVDPLLRARSWCARLIATEEDPCSRTLDGTSFGLSMCLANASLLLQVPLSPNVVACAAVGSDGSILPVEGLTHKLRIIFGTALAVRRVLVAAPQLEEARDVAARAGVAPNAVCGVSRLAQAVAEVLPDIGAALDARWEDLDFAIRSAHALHRVTLDDAPAVLDWKAVVGSADRLVERLSASADPSAQAAARMATLAARIAARHAGANAPLAVPDNDALEALPRPLRFRLLAHVMQSATDGSDEETRQCLDIVLPKLPPPRERSADELRLAGAAGRAFASIGDYGRALALLDEAVQGWLSIHAEQHASHPLCEELRVLGVLAAHAATAREGPVSDPRGLLGKLLGLEYSAVELHPEVADRSIGFLRLAAGRALVQAGDADRALEFLDDGVLDWAVFPAHLAHARLRWRARAHDARGNADGAAWDRARIDGSDVAQSRLARLDEAIRDNAGTDELARILDLLRGDEASGPEIERLLRRVEAEDVVATARFVAEHYRY